jgi:DNA polymerase-3 subunit epsilon
LVQHKLRLWPFAGPIGLREQHPQSGRTDIHVFEQWSHLGSAQDESELEDLLQGVAQPLAFDLDSYRLLQKQLATPTKLNLELMEFKRHV